MSEIRIKMFSSIEETSSLTEEQKKQFVDLYNQWIDLEPDAPTPKKRMDMILMGFGMPIKCLLFEGDKLIGFRIARPVHKELISEVTFIDKHCRGKGYNQKMMAKFEQYAREHGFERIIYSYMSPSMLRSFKLRARRPKFMSLDDFIKFKKQKTRDNARFAPKTKRWIETHTIKKGERVTADVNIGILDFVNEQDFVGVVGMVDLTTPKKDNRREFHVGSDGTILVQDKDLKKIKEIRNSIREFHTSHKSVARIVSGKELEQIRKKRIRTRRSMPR